MPSPHILACAVREKETDGPVKLLEVRGEPGAGQAIEGAQIGPISALIRIGRDTATDK